MNKFSIYTDTFQSNNWYQVFTYPAGEMQVRITAPQLLEKPITELDRLKSKIVARIYGPTDMVELALLYDAIDGLGMAQPELIVPYLPFSRADRRFVKGDCNGAHFISKFLLGLTSPSVSSLDIHNSKAVWRINNLEPTEYIVAAINHTAVRYGVGRVAVLFPDEGAAIRYRTKLPTVTGSNKSIIAVDTFFCTKKRDPITGKLLSFNVPYIPRGLPVLIVDDICDGGGTFVGIAETLKKNGMHYSLYTTHSMYSKGTGVLFDAGFEYLYTTNSYYRTNDNTPDKMVVYDCIPQMIG